MAELSLHGELLRTDLRTQGYALVEHGISTDDIDAGIQAYADFTDNLPDPEPETLSAMMAHITDKSDLDDINRSADTQSEWHKYRTNHPQFAKPGGYTNRWLQAEVLRAEGRKLFNKKTGQFEEVVEDPKEFFHFHPNSLAHMNRLAQEYGWGPLPPEVDALNKAWMRIHSLAFTAMKNTLQLVEETHPGILDKFVQPKDIVGSPIRINWYYHDQGDMLAGGHTDKGFSTIQIAESHVGFRARKPGHDDPESVARYQASPLDDPNMVLLRRSAEHGIYFPATALRNEQAFPDSELQPLWHDVIYDPELNDRRSVVGKKCGRWSVIAFANSEAAGLVTKEQTHSEETTALTA